MLISLTRKRIRSIRTTISQAFDIKSRSSRTAIGFQASREGAKIIACHGDVAVEHAVSGDSPFEPFAVPLAALAECEGGRDDSVTIRRDGDNVVLEWRDAGIPQVIRHDLMELPVMPAAVATTTANDPSLLAALSNAVYTADHEPTRYALNCIRLSGDGQVVATDGRQAYIHSGFAFPWEGEVLVPASRVITRTELSKAAFVNVGKSDDWFILHAGAWRVWLKINKDARFPKVDQNVPSANAACSTMHLSDADAVFLAKAIQRLPSNGEFNKPVTVDLNGAVSVRAVEASESKPTEIVLTSSSREGDAIRFSTNREYLARATRLGFRSVHITGQESPACCRDQQRTYLWALLGKAGVVPSDPEATRIESPTSHHTIAISQERNKPMITGKPEHPPKQAESSQAETVSVDSLIESAESVKASLRESTSQVTELIAALKRHRRQSKTLQSALSSIRALQAIDA
ncbi:hypothetical protein Pla8534_66500 [Lignipirellula cremea]|uniref:DNA polymerase III subunit beta n=2 Tax=Lignipirellula cremea TaxID=2528010 RepID=A0A518E3U7_9BACT|nr:hypothetical protein Pla8534_66500 [Lignipirellula cremea]